jgi:hypothetical protein
VGKINRLRNREIDMRIASYLAGAALAVSSISTIPASADETLAITADIPGIQAMAATEMAEVRGATLTVLDMELAATDGPVPEGETGLLTATSPTQTGPVIYDDVGTPQLTIGVLPTVVLFVSNAR